MARLASVLLLSLFVLTALGPVSAGRAAEEFPQLDYYKKKKFLQEMQPKGQRQAPELWYAQGELYYYGEGGYAIDYVKTFELWSRAADAQYVKAYYGLGLLYERGHGISRDYAMARSWLSKAADAGYAPAYYQLGAFSYQGLGVPKDSAAAAKWFTRGAEAGDDKAMYALGLLHYTGDGTALDFAKAHDLWLRSAEKGSADAQFNLATMYESGTGVEKNMNTALRWYRAAASQNHRGAIKALKDLSAHQ